jgi:hypothetical protein
VRGKKKLFLLIRRVSAISSYLSGFKKNPAGFSTCHTIKVPVAVVSLGQSLHHSG